MLITRSKTNKKQYVKWIIAYKRISTEGEQYNIISHTCSSVNNSSINKNDGTQKWLKDRKIALNYIGGYF